jgi:hypothetical protein
MSHSLLALPLLVLLLLLPPPLLGAAPPSKLPNMNADEYLLSQTPGGERTQARFPTRFGEYGRGVSSFDVYSPPISHLYSQVFWKQLPPVDLPDHVVDRFKGKGMAVVGFEMDQVRTVAGEGDVSVPINAVYNRASYLFFGLFRWSPGFFGRGGWFFWWFFLWSFLGVLVF